MSDFLNQMRAGPRKIAITGHFGCGKTELAVSLAMALAAERGKGESERLALCDLDIENPYFRSRERQEALERRGVRVYSDPFDGRNGSELQLITAAIRAPLEDAGCRVLCDCGGDKAGAMILNQFKKYFHDDFRLLCVVNCNRPGTDTIEKAVGHIRAIEDATGLRVTALVSNAHLVRYTTAETVAEGWAFTKRVESETGIPVLCACCMEHLAEGTERKGIPVFPIGMYMRDSYLDKQV